MAPRVLAVAKQSPGRGEASREGEAPAEPEMARGGVPGLDPGANPNHRVGSLARRRRNAA